MRQCVLALGTFDGVHQGHLALIKAASQMAQQLNMDTAVFTFAEHPQELLTGEKIGLICTANQRTKLLKKAGAQTVAVERFAEMRNLSPEEFVAFLVEKYRVGGLVCGKDFRFGKGARGDSKALKELCEQRGLAFCEVDFVRDENGEKISSSRIRDMLQNGQMQAAERLLGRAFFLEGEVCHGKGLARKWKTPTINQAVPKELVTLPLGVYQSRVYVAEKPYPAITNVGRRPTFDDGDFINAETHILEGTFAEIKSARVELLSFLRPEKKYENETDLQAQIQKDIALVKKLKY